MTLDERFGVLRPPVQVDDWEKEVAPVSRTTLDHPTARALQALKLAAKADLVKHSLLFHRLLWAINEGGSIIVSVEELAPHKDIERRGYPLMHGFKHDAEIKKLGHPTLVDGGQVRIAGELLLDEDEEGQIVWYMNDHSGRYCKSNPPKKHMVENAAELMRSFGLEVEIDDL